MNPGEIWELDDDTRRLVLSHPTYNASTLGRVITCVIGDPPAPGDLDPFAVPTPSGYAIYPDRIAMHPRDWLIRPVGRLDEPEYETVRQHLRFLLTPPRR